MKSPQSYVAKNFSLKGLNGISDKTLDMHFKLYEGYVKTTNTLNTQLAGILKDGKVDQEETPAYSELTRRLGFEYNGMVLHELYFENLTAKPKTELKQHGRLKKALEDSFGSIEVWLTDFAGIGKMRGVGWVICYANPQTGQISNHWVSLHESGNVAGFLPLLVMDVWEHAYLLDFSPSERGKYIESFVSNVDWDVVADRHAVDS